MKSSLFIAAVIAAGFTSNVNAQDITKEEMMANAKARAEVYVKSLGVDQATADKMAAVYLGGEEQVAPLHAEMKNIHAKMEETMKGYDEKAESMLTAEQRQKMEVMKKEGTWGAASCAKGEAKAGCSHEHGAAAGGCCAGDAKGKSKHTEEHKH